MGKKAIASIVLGLVLGGGAYFVDGKSVSDALSLAFGDTKVKEAYCVKLLNGE